MDEETLIARSTVVRQQLADEFRGRAATLPVPLPEVYLHPGQSHVANHPAMLKMRWGLAVPAISCCRRAEKLLPALATEM